MPSKEKTASFSSVVKALENKFFVDGEWFTTKQILSNREKAKQYDRLARECHDLPIHALLELMEGMPTEESLWWIATIKLKAIRDLIREDEK